MKQEAYGFTKLAELIRLERKEISSIYFYAILSGLIQLSLPLGIQAILGFVLGATMVTSVYVLILIIIAGVFLLGYLQINQMKIIEKIQQKIFVRHALAFAETIPRFDFKDIDRYYLPEKINRFFETVNVQKGISKLLLDIPAAVIQIVLGLILLSLYHPLFILFSFMLVLIMFLIFRLTSKKGLETSIAESDYKYKVVAWLEEMGRVIKSLKYSQGTHLNLVKTDEQLMKYLSARTSHFKVLLIQFKSLVFFKLCITALMLILGSYLLFNQKINIGQFVAAEIIIITIINSLEKLIKSLEHIYDVVTGIHKLNAVLDIELEKDGSVELQSNQVDIELRNVTFSYSDEQTVFEGLSLCIKRNSITCISGEENSGKSTLLKLLKGSYRPNSGMIMLNNIPLQHYSMQHLRAQTGVYFSEQDLFEGSLYDNISLGKPDVSIQHIIALTEKLHFDNFISFFPVSFNSPIDPLGRRLPSSIKKKILLLRALSHNPILLILEDPWTGLDENATQGLQSYLMEVSKTRTVIISTNDRDFAGKCMQQIHLKNGEAIIKTQQLGTI
jgi:ABC-type bacteriocin/lantibiotic exporter with double-glycine peptidase domain